MCTCLLKLKRLEFILQKSASFSSVYHKTRQGLTYLFLFRFIYQVQKRLQNFYFLHAMRPTSCGKQLQLKHFINNYILYQNALDTHSIGSLKDRHHIR